jgi:hypothetical protein
MANFHDIEMAVIRHAEANGFLTVDPDAYALGTANTVADLCDAISGGKSVAISAQMGRVAIDMIRLCAMLDIDLAKCLQQALEKTSAKPEAPQTLPEVPNTFKLPGESDDDWVDRITGAPSNVVQLKKE